MSSAALLSEVKRLRAEALDLLENGSHGVGSMFFENFRAAVSVLYGNGEELMRTGHRARQYADDFASDMGMKTDEWAGWIIEQNKIQVQKAHRIERAYLRLMYLHPSGITEEQVKDFRMICINQ